MLEEASGSSNRDRKDNLVSAFAAKRCHLRRTWFCHSDSTSGRNPDQSPHIAVYLAPVGARLPHPLDCTKALQIKVLLRIHCRPATVNGKEGVTSSSLVPGLALQAVTNAIGKGSGGVTLADLRTISEHAPNISSGPCGARGSRQRFVACRLT